MNRHCLLKRVLVITAILGLAAIEPLTHGWILWHPPAGTVPSGMHIGDSAHHLLCMRSFANSFHSPFALCVGPEEVESWRLFATPFFLLYGVAGMAGRMLGMNEFLFLGLLNGAGGALLLWMAYRLFRTVLPEHAETAFFLYALGGGLGGALFLGAAAFGLHHEAGFERWFSRFAWCELIEGQHFSPVMLMPRFYYTFPLALGLGALNALLRGGRRDILFIAPVLLFSAAFINLRLGPMFGLVGGLYLLDAPELAVRERLRRAAVFWASGAMGVLGAVFVLRANPHYTANVAQVTQQVLRFLPYLSAAIFLWMALLPGLAHAVRTLPPVLRALAGGLGGYLASFTALYFVFQGYYGNWLYGGDTAAAVAVSDPALLGVLPGALAAYWRWPPASFSVAEPARRLGWVGLWLLLFLAVSVSAWGHGWFMQWAPQRFAILLGPPMAILAASGLARCRPCFARGLLAVLLVCGLLSVGTASAWFQGPLGRAPGAGAFAYLHYELMTPSDAALIRCLPGGTVAAPGWSPIAFGEILSLRENIRVIGGPGAMNLGGQPFGPLQQDVARFFSKDAGEAFRRGFVRKYCVDAVYCPDTCPVAPEVMKQFRALPWLEVVAEAGRGVVFQCREIP